jgi:hypothetical protein
MTFQCFHPLLPPGRVCVLGLGGLRCQCPGRRSAGAVRDHEGNVPHRGSCRSAARTGAVEYQRVRRRRWRRGCERVRAGGPGRSIGARHSVSLMLRLAGRLPARWQAACLRAGDGWWWRRRRPPPGMSGLRRFRDPGGARCACHAVAALQLPWQSTAAPRVAGRVNTLFNCQRSCAVMCHA